MKRSRLLLASVTVLGLVALTGPPARAEAPPAYFVNEAALPFAALPGTTTTRYWGVHGGAGYRVEVPADWNGDLVLYAHGFRGTGLELTVSNPPLRPFLVQHGFAWAASSYGKNGYDVKQGVKDTHALGALFNGLVGRPRRTYLTGHSMGGHITGVAIEQYPRAYAGALPMCGVMGDAELFDFFLDFNLVAQALTGVAAEFPAPPDYLTADVPFMKAALGAGPPGFPFTLSPAGLGLAGVTQNLTGGPRPLFAAGFGFWNGPLVAGPDGVPGNFLFGLYAGDGTLGVAAGNVPGNEDTVYQIDTSPALSPAEALLNATVLRVSTDPQGRHPDGLAGIPPISGDLPVPVVTLHTLGDLFVPFSMEQIYARRAAAQGAADRLVSRAIRDVLHCGFDPAEEAAAFADLVTWVETGVRPAGDDVLAPAVVAGATFGCQFTQSSSATAYRALFDPVGCP